MFSCRLPKIKVNRNTERNRRQAWNFNNIAGIYKAYDDFSQALEYYQKALEISQEIGKIFTNFIRLN